MEIKIINVSDPIQKMNKANKSYYQLTVTYEGDFGKMEQKQLMNFVFPEVYNYFRTAKRDDKVEITRSKNAAGYWDWTAVSEAGPTTVEKASAGTAKPSAAAGTSSGYEKPKSNYETSEERAWRQILIVRQSSVSAAVAALKDKGAVDVKTVLAFATQIEEWVNRKPTPIQEIIDMEDDIPQ